MKKIALIILTMITIPTHATTMCAVNDSVGVILDPSITIKSYSKDANMGTWLAWSDSWTVYGVSACLNSNRGKGMGGTVPHLHDTDNDGNDHLVTGGEKYGQYCWCRLTHPAYSLWTFNLDYGSMYNCASYCVDTCGNHFYSRPVLRDALFNSISN